MDPIYDLDEDGDGTVTFYAWGNSYKAKVTAWKVDSLEIVEYFDPKAYAQKQVNRYYTNPRPIRINETVERLNIGTQE